MVSSILSTLTQRGTKKELQQQVYQGSSRKIMSALVCLKIGKEKEDNYVFYDRVKKSMPLFIHSGSLTKLILIELM
jgi:hypothetical protein